MRSLVVVALVLAAGCVLDEDYHPYGGPSVVSKVEIKEIPLYPRRKVDLLFVIDSAPSMAGEQATLAANARSFMAVLEAVIGGVPNIHIGVVDTDLGTLGVDVGDSRCSGQGSGGRMSTFDCGVTGAFVSHELDRWGDPSTNYPGTLADTFACVATSVGANGCPWRQPLQAMRLGVAQGRENGFLRDEAYLIVVFLGDGDDCSAADRALYGRTSRAPGPIDPFRCFAQGVVCDGLDDPSAPGPRTGCRPREGSTLQSVRRYVDELKALKPDPRDVLVAAVTPDGEIVVEPGTELAEGCRLGANAGTPAVRLRTFLDAFVDRNVSTTVCSDDWTYAMAQLAELNRTTLDYHTCIWGQPVDTDPDTPGLQPDIAAAIVEYPDHPSTTVSSGQTIPRCGSALPCVRVQASPSICDSGLELGLEPPFFIDIPSLLMAQIVVE